MKKNLWMLALFLVAGLLLVLLLSQPDVQVVEESGVQMDSTITITEVCAKNETVIADNDGKYRDYIELYNSGEPVSLDGFAFYNGKVKSEPIADITLKTGEYRVFFISRSISGFAFYSSQNKIGFQIGFSNWEGIQGDEHHHEHRRKARAARRPY